jgi:hypothetical protein
MRAQQSLHNVVQHPITTPSAHPRKQTAPTHLDGLDVQHHAHRLEHELDGAGRVGQLAHAAGEGCKAFCPCHHSVDGGNVAVGLKRMLAATTLCYPTAIGSSATQREPLTM